ncbi:MAG: hypothetical protein DCF32_14805 [Leptolyngbya sp.]|nr:MAG: hypothetical protein DCF32_14805 [Leptolyngbya sp.]
MPTPISTLIAHARQGDARAIAQLLTPSLAPGVVARGQWRGTTLHLDLEADTAIPQDLVVPHIRRGMMRLGLTCPIDSVWVSGRQTGADAADWQASFSLKGASGSTGAQVAGVAEEAGGAPSSLPTTAENAGPAVRSQDSSAGAAVPSARDSASPPASNQDRSGMSDAPLVVLAHLVPLVSYLAIGSQWLGGWPLLWGSSFLLPWRVVLPLVLLLVKGTRSASNPNADPSGAPNSTFMQSQAKEALNFQLTMLIAWIVTIALMFILLGFLLVVPLALIEIVSCIVAATQAAEGKPVRYAIAIRFVR